MSSIRKSAITVVMAAGVVAGACGSSQPQAEVRTATVARGTVTQTVAVSGSVNAAAQVRLNFKTGGRLAEVYVTTGQQVTAGQPLAKLDATDLEVAAAQAQAGIARAQANYDQAVAGASAEDVASARQAVDNAQRSLDESQRTGQNDIASAQQSVAKLRTNFTAARTTFASLTTDVRTELTAFTLDSAISQLNQARTDLNALLNANGGNQFCTGSSCPSPGTTSQTATEGKAAQNSLSSASASLANAQNLLTNSLPGALADYGASADAITDIAGRFEAAMQSGVETAQLNLSYQNVQVSYTSAAARLSSLVDQLTTAVSAAQTSITAAQAQFATTASRNDQSYESVRQELVTLQMTLTTQAQYLTLAKSKTAQAATPLGTLTDAVTGGYVSAIQGLSSTQERTNATLVSAQNSLQSANASLAKIAAAPKSYDIAAAYAGVLAESANLNAAQNNLANAVLKAPVPGVVGPIGQQIGEFVSGGGTANPFIVVANISNVALHGTVGEADVAKLSVGQVATIIVDAVGPARMTGKLTSIDPVATIQQGVPVYGVDVTIDVLNQAVRPGMSGTANVIIANRQSTLVVPNLAVRNQSGRRYIVLLQNAQQVDTDVTFGLSNDTVTEILTGVSEGDTVVLPQPRAGASVRPPQIGGGPPGGGR